MILVFHTSEYKLLVLPIFLETLKKAPISVVLEFTS